jgi:Bacterial regulatory protein, arsR family.
MPRERRYVEAFRRWVEILRLCDGERGVAEIAEALGMRLSTVSDYIDVLEELGLVKTEIKGLPRKRVPVLTEKGRCLVECFK